MQLQSFPFFFKLVRNTIHFFYDFLKKKNHIPFEFARKLKTIENRGLFPSMCYEITKGLGKLNCNAREERS